jgi:hypothetical protein
MDVYKPISNVHNLVLAMLWRHPENVELGKVKVVHYCAAVRTSYMLENKLASDGHGHIHDIHAGFKALEVHRRGGEHG